MRPDKQPTLKPFDFVLATKLAVNRETDYRLAQLAEEFDVSLSTIHASLIRAEAARLLSRSSGAFRALRPSLQEFAISGLKYAFPAVMGPSTRGVPTSVGTPVLAKHFEGSGALTPVWPYAEGTVFGSELVPLHPSVPRVALKDERFYEVLGLVDAVRVGAAREREIAIYELQAKL